MPVLSGPSGMVAEVRIASSPLARMRGLIGTKPLAPDEGLVLRPCNRVHTFGLGYPIDAVFCDRTGLVVSVQTLRPRSFSRRASTAHVCVELPAGRAAECGIDVGTRLDLQ